MELMEAYKTKHQNTERSCSYKYSYIWNNGKITKDYTESLEELIINKKDISKFIQEIKKVLDEVGRELVGASFWQIINKGIILYG